MRVLIEIYHRCLLLLFICLFLLVMSLSVGLSLAQQMNAPAQLSAVPVLQLLTYDDNWLRYDNETEDADPKLAVDGHSLFPFSYVVSVFPQDVAKLESAAATGELFARYDLEYDAKQIVGYCDSDKLGSKSTDVICAPGPCDMPAGYVFLALYHPETLSLVSLTTTIDNVDGVASRASACPIPQISSEAGGEAQQGGSQSQGCGPYVPGQWIKPADYAASGLNLPIVRHELAGNVLSDYECIVPGDGRASYLLAYTIAPPPPSVSDEPAQQQQQEIDC